MGQLEIFFLAEWAALNGAELRHPAGIKSLHPNYLGTRILFVDATNVSHVDHSYPCGHLLMVPCFVDVLKVGYLYNPVNAELITVPGFPDAPRLVFWDTLDRYGTGRLTSGYA